jgi:outer membrane protein OmpA-like peptidoglycan-associated protein
MAAGMAALLAAPLAHAQSADLSGATAEELQLLFQRQKSRGLKLAPNTAVAPTITTETVAAATDPVVPATETAEPATETAVAETAEPAATTETAAADPVATVEATEVTVAQTAPVAETAAAETQPVAVAYTELDKADQINFRIGFDFDSAVLRDAEKPKLATLCTAMKAVDVAVFRIVGHTDAAGTDAYNEKLSLLRAEEVKRHLVSDCGIEPARLQAVGVGKRYLYNVDDPRSEENRRVEFQALS